MDSFLLIEHTVPIKTQPATNTFAVKSQESEPVSSEGLTAIDWQSLNT